VASRAPTLLDRLLRIDRRIIFLLVALSVTIPILLPLGLPVSTTVPTQMAFDYIETLKPGDAVWLSFDYGPSSAPENDPMAEGFMRHALSKDLRVIVCVLYPLGGLGLANNSLARVAEEFPDKKYGVDYVNLGYKDGPEAVMRRLGENIADAFPTDVNGRPVAELPIFKPSAKVAGPDGVEVRTMGIRSIRDVKVVFTAATGLIGEYWITLVNAQSGTPVIIGPTAVSAPKYYAFISSGQLAGMLGGMKGAAEYEQLLAKRYPNLGEFYRTTRLFTATKGMDAQTGIHLVIILFILIGNVAFLLYRLRESRAGSR
jgi:hypothetical protein